MPLQAPNTIAVLPFVNMSGNAETEYFSDGMTEEIINALAKIKGLKVTSRTSSFFFKNKTIPLPQIGQELNVSTILEGSIRLAGNMMRITAQLIDVIEDVHFWSETFDRAIGDVFAVQDEISLLIADKLREHIGHFEIEDHLVDQPDIPVEVYQSYLRGRYHLMKLTVEETEKGIAILKEVIAAQPDFPLPYLDINQGYAYLGTMGLIPAQEAFVKAKPFLDKAIELNENLAESQLNLAWNACWQNWDLPAAYRHIHQALEIRPADNIYLTLANTLSIEGKFKPAHAAIDKALQLAPLSGINHHFKGFLYYLEEKYQEAIACFETSLRLQPDLPFPPLYWGSSLLLMGKIREGLAYFQSLTQTPKGDLTQIGGIALAHILSGDEAQTRASIQSLEAALQTDSMGSAMSFLMYCHTLMGQHEEALTLLEKGINMRLPNMLLLYTEPFVKPLRADSRFQKLLRQALGKQGPYKPPRKYKKSLLPSDMLESSKQQLETLMQQEQLFLDPQLSLRQLAERLNLTPNQLSQLLNEGFDKNFAEYVNTYRLDSFTSKVADARFDHLTILAIAYESGFNSKTVFNTFFKKKMGMTPRAYWKSEREKKLD